MTQLADRTSTGAGTRPASDPVAGALAGVWMVSSDSHIVEPPDLWDGRVDELGERGAARRLRGRRRLVVRRRQEDDVVPRHPDRRPLRQGRRRAAHLGRVRRRAPGRVRPCRLHRRERDRRRVGIGDLPEPGPRALLGARHRRRHRVDARVQRLARRVLRPRHRRGSRASRWSTSTIPTTARPSSRACRDLGLCGALITVMPPPWMPFRDRVRTTASGRPRRTSTCRSACTPRPTAATRASATPRSAST